MTRFSASLRLAVLAVALAALGGCLPLMFDRDWNWKDAEPSRPGFGSALQPHADEPATETE